MTFFKLFFLAAHCFGDKRFPFKRNGIGERFGEKLNAEDVSVALGKYNISNRHEQGSDFINIEKLIIHNDWKTNLQTYDGDIAILVLNGIVEFSPFVQPICLPPLEWKNKALEKGKIAGWGFSERSKQTKAEDVPRKVEIDAPPTNGDCFIKYPELTQISSARTFCAGGNNTGPCSGDSGEH
jgi:hypothetical protein